MNVLKDILMYAIIIGSSLQLQGVSFTVPKRWEHPQALAGSRESSLPYMSGDTFRAISDFIIDEKYIPFDPERVQHGDIIFVSAEHLDFYFNTVHPHIRMPYILITHNSDNAVPGNYKKHLDDNTIIAWFGQNYDGTPHPKFFPIPIGLANRHWIHGNIEIVSNARSQVQQEKKYLAHLNFVDSTNNEKRVKVRNFFKNKPFCHISAGQSYKDYLKDFGQSAFVICPEGNGLDCHRTWEALLMGAIPVMLHSSLDPLYEELPVLLVDDWQEVTKELLVQASGTMRFEHYDLKRMFAPYWINKIMQVKSQAKEQAVA